MDQGSYVSQLAYSPLLGGFTVIINDGRAAFLVAGTLKFDPNSVQVSQTFYPLPKNVFNIVFQFFWGLYFSANPDYISVFCWLQGIWAGGVEDVTCTASNHKFRLMAFGRKNSQVRSEMLLCYYAVDC